MAKQQDNTGSTQDTNSVKQNTYTKGLYKDFNDSYVPEGVWINAINAVTASNLGDTGTIGNEPSNEYCVSTNFDVIGIIRRDATTWVVFSTNDITSEVGIFTETDCTYERLISSTCLGFKRSNLITGAIQTNYDCTFTVFWSDGLNPDRAINLDRIPWQIEKYTGSADCPIPIYFDPPRLDCDKTRLHYLIDTPCFELQKSTSAGTLFNGSYQVAVAYSINGLRVTDYFNLSNLVSIWTHENNGGSVDLEFSTIDTNFEEYEVVLISTVNETTRARRVGFYSTAQTRLHIDNNNDTLIEIPLEDIPINEVIYETSDKMFLLNFTLLRTGMRSKFDFNYQPLANQIVTKWVQAEYPADYYVKGNNETGYMRDEIYSFFIRWVYKTGDKSASYHIPGRPIKPGWDNTLVNSSNPDLLPYDNAGQSAPKWKVYNTGISLGGSGTLPDGASIKNTGYMAYWESEERYPVKPNIYNSSAYAWSNITSNPPYPWSTQTNNPSHTPPQYYADYDLCGMPIRHHKFPDDTISQIYNDVSKTIQIMGVKFENIKPPVDLSGKVIKSIIGYEILRGSREGNRTVIAKGIINNMFEYNVPNQPNAKALYQNYPYNSLEPDMFLRANAWYEPTDPRNHDDSSFPMTTYKKDYFTFHSPEFNFRGVYLNPNEIRVYGQYYGTSYGTFVQPYGHPKQKIPSHGAFLGCLLIGLGTAIHGLLGKKTTVKGNNRSLVGGLTTAAVAAAGGPGGAAAAAATTVLGGTQTSGGVKVGTSTGTDSAISLPQLNTESNELNVLNTNTRKPGIIAEFMSFITQVNMIITIGGFLLAQGFGNAMKALMELLPWRQYALQYNSHGFYNNYKLPIAQNYRREIKAARYIRSTLQTFDPTYLVNNVYRPNTIMFNIKNTLANPSVVDQSRKTVNQLKAWNNPDQNYSLPISSYYGGLKLDLKSAYGQLPSITQLPISPCVEKIVLTANKPQASSVYFRGDVYINRYTEKNSFPLFNSWLFDAPDGTDFNYKFYANVPYPRYWAAFEDLDLNDISIKPTFPKLSLSSTKAFLDFAQKFGQFVVNPIGSILNWVTGPSKFFHLDRDPSQYGFQLQNLLKKTFYIKNGYFYLFVNGVRDFYCESEINLSCRDFGAQIPEQFYNPYGYNDLYSLFRTDIIKVPEYFKYDYSLSASKVAASYISWGKMLSREFNPDVAETCLQYFPTRMVYSLQQQYEQSRDNWRIFLANNYKDFENVVTSVKPINRTGSAILFEDAIPTTINGVDELISTTGNKITIGDGGLFKQAFQNLTNADLELEYGSCQDTRSVVNTPFGIFWISQRNGKIMELAGNQIVDISVNGMRYWFAENLKYNLLETFPDYAVVDNTVKGIGCQTVYDSQYEIVYFSKKDYKLVPGIKTTGPNKDIEYDPEKKEFKVKSYSYDFKLTYGPGSTMDIQDGYQIRGEINGYNINTCTYNSANPIGDFVTCVANAIKGAPNVERVIQNIASSSFTIQIILADPKVPATVNLDVVYTNKFVSVSTPISINTETFKYIDPSDSDYFEDCSWTVSYDPKVKMWVSFHDWHPDLLFASNDHFYSIKHNSFWKHNNVCDSYNNYYGVNHGWEIEFPVNTGTTVTSIKSIEYYLEVFKYNMNCADRYHVLDGNFDQALVYNTEQTSGLLNLHIKPKNNPVALLNYPRINPDSIDIHVAKEENKYRFNQFWDTTKDRGEFDGLEITNFITECNGYRKNLNPQAVNYFKSPLQRKKFRHYGNRVILRKLRSGAEKMNLKVVATKETLSPR